MDELKSCPQCAEASSSERFTIDRLGVHHWFRQCPCCGHRWSVQHLDPAYDNPYTHVAATSWRPEPSPPSLSYEWGTQRWS